MGIGSEEQFGMGGPQRGAFVKLRRSAKVRNAFLPSILNVYLLLLKILQR
jgi:hypothetical protein